MWKQIDNLRQQPEEARQSFAFFASFCITGFLLVSWAVLPDTGDSDIKDSRDLLSPFGVVERSLSVGAGEVGRGFSNIKEKVSGLSRQAEVAGALPASGMATATVENTLSTTTSAASSTGEEGDLSELE